MTNGTDIIKLVLNGKMQKTIPNFILIFTMAQFSFGQSQSSVVRTGVAQPPPAKSGGVIVNDATVRAHFAPDVPLAQEVVKEIAKARKSIMVQACKFTSGTILQALGAARNKGITVEVILDKDHRPPNKETLSPSLGDSLLSIGVPVYIDSEHAVANNNVIIIDDRLVITGSYSFTDSEKIYAENIVIIDNIQIAEEYAANWTKHRNHSAISGTVTTKASIPPSAPKPRTDPRPNDAKSNVNVKRPVPPTKPKSK